MSQVNYVTKDTFEQMQAELQKMKGVERPAASRAIAEAREKGDLKENAEYDAAKEAQGQNEEWIKQLEDKLARAEVIDPSKLEGSKVAFGAHVKLLNADTDEEVMYRIVGADESDINAGQISVTSPVARSLLGKEAGDEVKIRTPGGERVYEILEVEFK